MHCALLHPVEKAYRELHLFDTEAPTGVRFYSGGWGRVYHPDRETAADAIVAQARDRIDFPRVIRAAYDAGARFFIEIGPGNSCSRMIGKILEDRPHAARSLCASAQEPLLGVLRVLACLAAEGVPVDLEALYGGPGLAELPAANARLQVRIAITGSPLSFPPVSAFPGVVHGGAGGESVDVPPPVAELAGAVAPPWPALGGTDDFEATLLTAMAGDANRHLGGAPDVPGVLAGGGRDSGPHGASANGTHLGGGRDRLRTPSPPRCRSPRRGRPSRPPPSPRRWIDPRVWNSRAARWPGYWGRLSARWTPTRPGCGCPTSR